MGHSILLEGEADFLRCSRSIKMEIINQYPFEFYGSIFLIYETDQNKLVIPIRDMCDVLGLNFRSQLQRIKNHMVLSENLSTIRDPVLQKNGKARESDLVCIALECLPYLLAWIDVKGMKRSARAKIIRYKRDVITMLWTANVFEILPDTLITELDTPNTSGQG